MINNLDEAIKHCEEVAEEHERHLKVYENMAEDRSLFKEEENECKECAKEHRQLAKWLRELKTYKDFKDKGYVMCRVVATQDIQSRTTRVILDVNTEKLFDNNVGVNTDE